MQTTCMGCGSSLSTGERCYRCEARGYFCETRVFRPDIRPMPPGAVENSFLRRENESLRKQLAQARVIKVKPLVWEAIAVDMWKALGLGGPFKWSTYFLLARDVSTLEGKWSLNIGSGRPESCDDLETGKQMAQRYLEAAVLSLVDRRHDES
jgi:hypothetical protein